MNNSPFQFDIPKRSSKSLAITAILIFSVFVFATPEIYSQDSIERVGSRPLRGSIIETSPTAVIIEVNGSNQTVKPGEIKKVTFGSTMGDLRKGLNAFYEGNYNDALDSFEKMDEKPAKATIAAEVAFCKAMAMAYEALGGGNITVRQAGIEVKNFLENHKDSFHFYEATRMFADLAMASGTIDAAKPYYKQLLAVDWPEQVISCHVELGKIALIENDADTAFNHFKEASKIDTADKTAQDLKIVARCRAAQAIAIKGEHDKAIQTIEAVIKEQSNENALIFSNAYNSLGNCYLKAGNEKGALLAFLHTQMLFPQPAENQAEALFHLKDLWQALNYPERARKAQQALTTSFSNTYYGKR